LIGFACGAGFSQKNLACGAFSYVPNKILSVEHFISESCLIYRFIGIEKDLDSNT
jgi:hypothetical protein